jgi:hypothetical protein
MSAGTRLHGIVIQALLAGAAPSAMGQAYRAPVGNCDASVMGLESARLAAVKVQAAAKAGGAACTSQNKAAVAAWLAAANGLDRRASGLLAACPGMDDAMAQGAKMAALARSQVGEATAAQQSIATACGPTR